VKFVATKKCLTKKIFSPLSFLPVFGSGMGKNQDPGSGINIPDPPHCISARQMNIPENMEPVQSIKLVV
jgi:hypothetical protein